MKTVHSPRIAVRLMLGASLLAVATPVLAQEAANNGGLDEIVDAIPARKLLTYWPASMNEWSTKAVRDAFYSSPLLPRLINLESIKRTIAAGIEPSRRRGAG